MVGKRVLKFIGKETITDRLDAAGYCPVPRVELQWNPSLEEARKALQASFLELVRDPFMGDGGRYRRRRFSRFRLQSSDLSLSPMAGTSIHQTLQDNPLNGGVTRTFEPLTAEVSQNPFLRELIKFDFLQLPVSRTAPEWVVGVHQVRIEAGAGNPGKPTPEGIHVDSEAFTVQHLFGRENIRGGEFVAYNTQKEPVFRWLQEEVLDSVFFTGTTYHSATPIAVDDSSRKGYRDIFLIDFDPISCSSS